jgi:hypothetical protein
VRIGSIGETNAADRQPSQKYPDGDTDHHADSAPFPAPLPVVADAATIAQARENE